MTENTVQKTSVDWFRLRTKSTVSDTVSAIRPMLGDLAPLLHHRPIERGGSLGFKFADELYLGQVKIGRFDYGGESQRGWGRLDLSAAGCTRLDWSDLDALESLESPEIRRLDIALTTENGEVDHDHVVAAHAAGRFITGGRPPDLREIISTNDTAGRTCYIGTREKSPKFMRCYEKGWQMLASFPRHIRESEVTIGGVHPSQIYRCELELKAVDMKIEFDAIYHRDEYFAGSYPFCADLLPDAGCQILTRNPKVQASIELAAALANIKNQCGNILFTGLHAYHGDLGSLFQQIVGTRHCNRLVEAGVLLPD
jgi:DNA relaxase NicK